MVASLVFAKVPLDGLSPELLRAARWIEAHPREVALHSMRECARRAALAPASLSRLSQALGFTGFDAVKSLCQESFTAQAGYAGRAEVLQASARRRKDWLTLLNEAQHANTASISALNQARQLEAAADTMLKAQRVYCLASPVERALLVLRPLPHGRLVRYQCQRIDVILRKGRPRAGGAR